MKTPFWQKNWFVMLMFFIVPPLGIVLMWLGKKDWNKAIKIILSVIFGFYAFLWALILLGSAVDDNSTEPSEQTTAYLQETEERTSLDFKTPTREENTTAKEETTTETATTKQETTTTKPTTTRKEPATPKPTTTQKVTTTAKPTTTKKETTTTKPTTVDPESKITVYVTKSGEKYHYENPCGNGTYYAISLADAKSQGYTACEKCVLH